MPSKTEINFTRLAASTERAVAKNPVQDENQKELFHKRVAVLRQLVEDMEAASRQQAKNARNDICAAAYNNDLELVQSLLASGTDVNKKDTLGRTPLIAATQSSSLAVVKFLVSAKASLNVQDRRGRTALHYAAGGGETAIVKELLEDRTKIMLDLVDLQGMTPLHCAEYAQQSSLASLLTRAGASRTIVDDYGYSVVNLKNMGGVDFRSPVGLDALSPVEITDPESKDIDDDTLSQYRRKLAQIEDLLDDDKMRAAGQVSRAPVSVQREQNTHLTSAQKTEEAVVRARTEKGIQDSARNELFGNAAASSQNKRKDSARKPLVYSEGDGMRKRNGFDTDESMLALQNARKQQNVLTTELSEMTNLLKRQNHDIKSALSSDISMLREGDAIADQNLSRMQAEGTRLDTHIKSTRSTTCGVFFMLMMVVLIWLGAYLFMKVFSKKS